MGVPCLGLGMGGSLAHVLLFLMDEPGAKSHPRQNLAILHFGSLRQTFVGSIVVQADRLPLAIQSSHCRLSVLRMGDERATLEAESTCPTIGLADSAL